MANTTAFSENDRAYVAHAANGRFHDLTSHLKKVAKKSSENAIPFGGYHWAYLAGLWHDPGKFRPGFQDYIRKAGAIESEIGNQ